MTKRNASKMLNPTSRNLVKLLLRTTLILSTLLLLISMTGCLKHYVVVDGNEVISVKKETLNNLYQDNENLLNALRECQEGN